MTRLFERDLPRHGAMEPTALDWRAKAAASALCGIAADAGQSLHVCANPDGTFSAFTVDHQVSCSLREVDLGEWEEEPIA